MFFHQKDDVGHNSRGFFSLDNLFSINHKCRNKNKDDDDDNNNKNNNNNNTNNTTTNNNNNNKVETMAPYYLY